jgi:7-carboxy-7-deazaguanine synthase
MSDRLFVTEVFTSVQGEGVLTGVPSVFVRLGGCNLRCTWCDTPYSSWAPEGKHVGVDELVEDVAGCGPRHVVLTGGEPMLQEAAVGFSKKLAARGFHITVETAGTIDAPLHMDLASISPKLSDSTPSEHKSWAARHDQARRRPDVVARLVRDHPHQLKFVLGEDTPLEEIESFVADVEAILGQPVRPDCILLMPLGRDVASLDRNLARAVPEAVARGWRISDRLHVRLFGDTRGT